MKINKKPDNINIEVTYEMWRIHDGGSQMKSDRFLIKAAELYYREWIIANKEIAKKLHTSRTSISRALIQARNEGYVQIRIQYLTK